MIYAAATIMDTTAAEIAGIGMFPEGRPGVPNIFSMFSIASRRANSSYSLGRKNQSKYKYLIIFYIFCPRELEDTLKYLGG
jgi:hypothetical protein